MYPNYCFITVASASTKQQAALFPASLAVQAKEGNVGSRYRILYINMFVRNGVNG